MRALLHLGYLVRQKQPVEDGTPLPGPLALEIDVDALPTFVSDLGSGR